MDDEVQIILPVQRLDDVVLPEGNVFGLGDLRAFIAGGDQIVETNHLARLIKDRPIQAGENFGEIAAQKPPPAGQHHGLAGESLGFVAQCRGDFLDIGLQ